MSSRSRTIQKFRRGHYRRSDDRLPIDSTDGRHRTLADPSNTSRGRLRTRCGAPVAVGRACPSAGRTRCDSAHTRESRCPVSPTPPSSVATSWCTSSPNSSRQEQHLNAARRRASSFTLSGKPVPLVIRASRSRISLCALLRRCVETNHHAHKSTGFTPEIASVYRSLSRVLCSASCPRIASLDSQRRYGRVTATARETSCGKSSSAPAASNACWRRMWRTTNDRGRILGWTRTRPSRKRSRRRARAPSSQFRRSAACITATTAAPRRRIPWSRPAIRQRIPSQSTLVTLSRARP